MYRRERLLLVIVCAVLMPVASAEAQWSRFGDAISVIGGPGPNTGAIQLSSTCSFTGAPPACDFDTLTFSGVAFQQTSPLTFAEILELSTDFNIPAGDCGGGSPRFQITLDTDINADGFPDNIFVHLGPSPNFTGCFFGWQNTGNLIGNNDVGRYDSGQVGGSGFGTYDDALAVAGSFAVLRVSLVVDGGWTARRGQAVIVDNVRVNDDKLTK